MPDTATGQAADFVGRREARFEDQHVQVAVGQARVVADQAALDRALVDRLAVEAGAVVADFQHDFRAFAAHRDADRRLLGLVRLAPLFGRFEPVRDGVAEHVLQRRGHAFEDVADRVRPAHRRA
jgi:hypothetical protein